MYKYILPFTPKFPEDYSGPLVDKYLALKFEEMEEKMRKQKGSRVNGEDEDGELEVESEEDNDDELGGISSIDQGISKIDQNDVMTERIVATTTTTRPMQMVTTTLETPGSGEDQVDELLEAVTGSNDVEGSVERGTVVPQRLQAEPLEVEINSDGSSGHLTPNFRLRG